MGFFDDLKKTINESGIKDSLSQVGKDLDKATREIGNDFNNSQFKEELTKMGKDLGITNGNSTPNKKVPDEYMNFPQFEGTIADLSTKKIDKYHRCTIDYNGVTDESVNSYITKIKESGFTKGSDVRYDKDNSYIIVEHEDSKLHLVFHVRH